MALMPTERMGSPPGVSPPMRMTASRSGSKRTYRIQVCRAKMRPMASSTRTSTHSRYRRTRSHQKSPVAVHHRSACSGLMALRNTSSAGRQAAKLCYRFGLDLFRALREPDRRRRDEERLFPLRTKNWLLSCGCFVWGSCSFSGEPSANRTRSRGGEAERVDTRRLDHYRISNGLVGFSFPVRRSPRALRASAGKTLGIAARCCVRSPMSVTGTCSAASESSRTRTTSSPAPTADSAPSA
jgi:hypothetical protein